MSNLKILNHGNKSEQAKSLQGAINRRLKARGLGALAVKEDGVVGNKTLQAARKVAWALGARSETYEGIVRKKQIPIGVQRMIFNPGKRSPAQLSIARQRVKFVLQKKEEAVKAEQSKSGREKAVNAFVAKAGITEQPPGSNRGPYISMMQSYWGFGAVPWCGISAGYHASVYGDMKGLRSDVASVAAIEDHARAHDKPYGEWVGKGGVQDLLRGSFIVIGGRGVHVAMKIGNAPGGAVKTIEGNTSFSSAGSQSNGGCIAIRTRFPSEIFGGASMNYEG